MDIGKVKKSGEAPSKLFMQGAQDREKGEPDVAPYVKESEINEWKLGWNYMNRYLKVEVQS